MIENIIFKSTAFFARLCFLPCVLLCKFVINFTKSLQDPLQAPIMMKAAAFAAIQMTKQRGASLRHGG